METLGYNLKGIILLGITVSVFSYDELQMVATTESPIRPGDNLTVHCGLTGEAKDVTLKFIRLFSIGSNGNKSQIVEVTPINGVETSKDIKPMSSVMGLIDKSVTSSSYLQYNQSSVTCDDLTTYYCTSEYSSNGTTVNLNASVDAYSNPFDLMAVTFPNKTDYPVGAEVTIMCDGIMGRPEEEWSWYKYNTPSKEWQPIRNNVVQSEPMQVSNCTFQRHSNYSFKITNEDEHMFSCTAGSDVEGSLYITISREASGAAPLMTSSGFLVVIFLCLIEEKVV